jgi:hypothetical protein
MPRPLTWLPRLHEIRRSVNNSSRSHYTRKELENLFQLQPRAALKLLELLPTTAVGTSHLVEREALANFLDQVHAAEIPSTAIESIRSHKPGVSRRKIRTLVRRDNDPVTLASLPSNLVLSTGHLEVSFNTIEELAQSMYALARAIEADGDELARRFEKPTAHLEESDSEDFASMMKELEALESRHKADS